ncbi:hypothetical protein ACROYT_G009367 [Oculina patagonica]
MISPHHPTHRIEQTTTPGTPCPTLYDECVGSLTSPADCNTEDAGDGAYGFVESHIFPIEKMLMIMNMMKYLQTRSQLIKNPHQSK